jgi:hypothetical protein
MGAPANDIGINPPRTDRRESISGVATGAGITYGCVVCFDSGTTNNRDVKLPAGANALLCAGVVQDQGDPNASGAFAVGDEFGICNDGIVEVLVDAGVQVHKGKKACTSATAGTVKEDTGTGNIVGQFMQDYDNTLGAAPVLVSMKVLIERAA